MEGKELSESGARALEARKLLPNFTILIPEEWQANVTFETIVTEDLKHLKSAQIVLADLYDVHLEKNGVLIKGIGTFMEMGFALARDKQIIVITRQRENVHPFFLHKSVHIVNSLDEACSTIRRLYNE
jgi:nucleoside 2-deoxyribosyltransferase